MRWIKIIFILIFTSLQAFAQIEMHGTDRASESLADKNKIRRQAIMDAFAKEAQMAKALKEAQADRDAVAKNCPLPAGWRPKKDVSKAKEWDIVPSGIPSKTYPRSSGMTTSDLKTDYESLGDPRIENCDYITVKFKGDEVQTVDFSKCEESEVTVESYRPCHDLLKWLAEKTKSK